MQDIKYAPNCERNVRSLWLEVFNNEDTLTNERYKRVNAYTTRNPSG